MQPTQTLIERLLSEKTGIEPQIMGSGKIMRAIKNRLACLGLSNMEVYWQQLQTSPQEFQQLVEEIVVPETWFFRDRYPFEFLVKHVRTHWLSQLNRGTFRLLSVPCSTGEEPYSMAIALLEAGLPGHTFTIDAIDISQLAITQAEQGIYGKNSFRGQGFVNEKNYFQDFEGKYQVCNTVRQRVKFRQGNLLSIFTEEIIPQYDVIFCRNLLIYLQESATEAVLKIIERLLLPQGLLFLGAAETAKIQYPNLHPIREQFTFAYQKTEGFKSSGIRSNKVPAPGSRSLPVSLPPPKQLKPAPVPSPQTPQKPSSSSVEPRFTLETARNLADSGQIEAAIEQCQHYLKQHRTSADAYTLLGILYQAKTDYNQAEIYLEKALYLNPNSDETLVHLALLKEYRGDQKAAKLLYQRLQKLK